MAHILYSKVLKGRRAHSVLKGTQRGLNGEDFDRASRFGAPPSGGARGRRRACQPADIGAVRARGVTNGCGARPCRHTAASFGSGPKRPGARPHAYRYRRRAGKRRRHRAYTTPLTTVDKNTSGARPCARPSDRWSSKTARRPTNPGAGRRHASAPRPPHANTAATLLDYTSTAPSDFGSCRRCAEL